MTKDIIIGWISLIVLIITCLVIGFFVGRNTIEKAGWDISKDPRGCIIIWDDSTYSVKSRTINIGTLKPGDSIIIKP
jgi:hypothetical protein